MKEMEKILDTLDRKIADKTNLCFFGNPAKAEIIEYVEFRYNIELPESYKKFLLRHDGGFFCSKSLAKVLTGSDGMATVKWNSLQIFGIHEFMRNYTRLRDKDWKLGFSWQGVYPFLPMGTTSTNELLVFINPLNSEKESPVFDAFHEDFPHEWGVVSQNFTEFLSVFIQSNGMMSTIASSNKKKMKDYMPKSGWRVTHENSYNLEEVREYYEKMTNYFPEEGKYFAELANTLREMGKYKEALINIELAIKSPEIFSSCNYYKSMILLKLDKYEEALSCINKEISVHKNNMQYLVQRAKVLSEMGSYEAAEADFDKVLHNDPEDSNIYYNRSLLYLKREQFTKALKDLFTAIEICSDSALYLSAIANVYNKMKDYENSLIYCNKSIEQDPEFVCPYITRENCYRATGEDEKAFEDGEKIVELFNAD